MSTFNLAETIHLHDPFNSEIQGKLNRHLNKTADPIQNNSIEHKAINIDEGKQNNTTLKGVYDDCLENLFYLAGTSNAILAALKNPVFRAHLSGSVLACLGAHYFNVAWAILHDESLCKKLNGWDLAWMGERHRKIAWAILEKEALWDQLCGWDLVWLSENHCEIALAIIKNNILKAKLEGEHIVCLADMYNEAALVIQNDDRLCAKLLRSHTTTKYRKH